MFSISDMKRVDEYIIEEGDSKCMFVYKESIFYSTKSIMVELIVVNRSLTLSCSFDCSPALEGHGNIKDVTCIDVTDSLIVAGYGNNVVQCWSREDEVGSNIKWTKCHNECTEGKEGVTCLKIDASSNTVYSGAWDHFIRSWDLTTGESKEFVHCHDWSILNFIVCREIDRIISGGNDGKTRVWDITKNCQVWEASHSMRMHAPHVFGEYIYVGTGTGLQQFSVNESKCHASVIFGGAMRAMDMAYSIELEKIFVSTVNCTYFAVGAKSCNVLWKKHPAKNWVVRVFVIKRVIITFTNPNNIDFWDTISGYKLMHLNLPFLNVDIKYKSTSRRFCVPTYEKINDTPAVCKIYSIDIDKKEILWDIETPVAVSSMASIFRESQCIGLVDGSIMIIDKDGGKQSVQSTEHSGNINRIATSPINDLMKEGRNNCLIVTGSDTLVCCWSISSVLGSNRRGVQLTLLWKRPFENDSTTVIISCLSLWKNYVFVGIDRSIVCFDLSTGKKKYTMREHQDTVVWIDIANEKYICTATYSSVKAHSLWFQENMAVPVCLLDAERDSAPLNRLKFESISSLFDSAYTKIVGIYLRFNSMYGSLFDFIIQAIFLLVTLFQRLGFSYANIKPPDSYVKFQNASSRSQSFLSVSALYFLEVIVSLIICFILMLLILFHKFFQRKAFENPQSTYTLLWSAILFMVQLIVGPGMMPALRVLFGVFVCFRDENDILKLQKDVSITCYSTTHFGLIIPSTIFIFIFIFFCFRLNRVDNNLGATVIRWNPLDYRGDLVAEAQRRHPLTVVNTSFNQLSLIINILLLLFEIFSGSFITVIANIIVACILLVASYVLKPFADWTSNQLMFLASLLLVFTYIQALVTLMQGSGSRIANALPWFSLFLLMIGIGLILMGRLYKICRRETAVVPPPPSPDV